MQKYQDSSFHFCELRLVNANIVNLTQPAGETNKRQDANKSYSHDHSNHTDFEFSYSKHTIISLLLYYNDSQL